MGQSRLLVRWGIWELEKLRKVGEAGVACGVSDEVMGGVTWM